MFQEQERNALQIKRLFALMPHMFEISLIASHQKAKLSTEKLTPK